MDREVFPRTDVSKALSGWIAVRVDAPTHPGLASQYQVEGYPTFIALRPDGGIARREMGALTHAEFISFLHMAVSSAANPPHAPATRIR